MLDWIDRHKDVLQVAISFGTLMVWLVYAQLLLTSHRRQRRPRVLINRGGRRDLDALCMISNMSAESIFIEHVLARVESREDSLTRDVTELERQEDSDGGGSKRGRRPADDTRQGPLGPGRVLHLGTFREVVDHVAEQGGVDAGGRGEGRIDGETRILAVTIQLLAVYGSDDLPVGLERRFRIQEDDGVQHLIPDSWDSRRLTGLRQRRRIRRLMEGERDARAGL